MPGLEYWGSEKGTWRMYRTKDIAQMLNVPLEEVMESCKRINRKSEEEYGKIAPIRFDLAMEDDIILVWVPFLRVMNAVREETR